MNRVTLSFSLYHIIDAIESATKTSQAAPTGSSGDQGHPCQANPKSGNADVAAVCTKLDDTLKKELLEYLTNELRTIREIEGYTSSNLMDATQTILERLRRLEESYGPNKDEVDVFCADFNDLSPTKTTVAHKMDLRFSRVASILSKLENQSPMSASLPETPKSEPAPRPSRVKHSR